MLTEHWSKDMDFVFSALICGEYGSFGFDTDEKSHSRLPTDEADALQKGELSKVDTVTIYVKTKPNAPFENADPVTCARP